MGLKFGIFVVVILSVCFADPLPNYGATINKLHLHTDPAARIVGGSVAPERSANYMAGVVQGTLWRQLVCGGSILTPRTILTAAHCIDAIFFFGSLARNAGVVVGTNRWRTEGRLYDIERNITHPDWNLDIVKNDIGMLVTTTNIVFSDSVLPVGVSGVFIEAGVTVRAVGWGRTETGFISDQLLELTLTTVEGERCVIEVAEAGINHEFDLPTVDPEVEICVRHSPNHGMCNGDSGSGLVRTDNGLLVGVVSWGVPCAHGAPDMFVRVSFYMNWILRNII